MYVYSSRVNTYDNPSPIFRQRGELSGSTPTSLKSTCATPLAHPSLCSARCLVHPAAPSLFAGNYIDRWFSSSLGNIGERRPRCVIQPSSASSFNLLFLHHFTPSFLSFRRPPPSTPSAWNLLFSRVLLSLLISLFLGFHPPLAERTPLRSVLLCFSLCCSIVVSSSLFKRSFFLLRSFSLLVSQRP